MVIEITVVVTSRVGNIGWEKGHRVLSRVMGMSCILNVCWLHGCMHLQNWSNCTLNFCVFYYVDLSQLKISLALLINEIQIKTMKNHFSLSRLEKIKKPDSPEYCQGCGAIETFIHFWWWCNLVQDNFVEELFGNV